MTWFLIGQAFVILVVFAWRKNKQSQITQPEDVDSGEK
jgi:hypothetical protein